jgi:hypothetical protein
MTARTQNCDNKNFESAKWAKADLGSGRCNQSRLMSTRGTHDVLNAARSSAVLRAESRVRQGRGNRDDAHVAAAGEAAVTPRTLMRSGELLFGQMR